MTWDQFGFDFFQSLTGVEIIDKLMVYLADYLVILLPLVLVYLWFKGREGKRDSLLTFGSAMVGLAVSYAMSLLYFHENPSAVFETIVAAKPENAFPSQHTAVIISAVWPLLLRERRNLSYLMAAVAFLTAFARIYIGEHYPIDVIGSFAASVIGFGIVYIFWDYLDPVLEPVIDLGEKVEDKML